MEVLEFLVDRELKIVECSRELEEARLGATAGLLGMPYFEGLPRIIREGSDAVAAVVDTGQPLSLTHYRFSCLFQSFKSDIDIFPLKNESDKPVGARVLIRTTKCCSAMNQLKRSQPLIDIGKNAAILSHGVRNPLNAIKGAVVYLKNRYSQEATLLEFTRIMEEEISQLDQFITGFLSGSAGEKAKSVTDLNGILKKIESLVSLQARTSGIELTFRYGKTLPMKVDSFQVEHAILNVVNNALHALSPGGKIMVESRAEMKKGAYFTIVEISDNGPGIPEVSHENYMSPLNESASSRGKGFGLFITREILQHHGGALELTSRKNHGTNVKLVLPAAKGDKT